jgi:voltage-gated potassium channel
VNAPKPELRLASLLGRRALTPRRAATIIGAYTLGITLAGGVLARIADPRDFHSLGTSLWWALQTVTTVGYGDVVPRSASGRAIGAVVMLSGIGFLTVVTASVTAALIEGVRDRTRGGGRHQFDSRFAEEISARLAAIEALLEERDAHGQDS